MDKSEMEGRDIYLRYTSKSGGASRIQQHRVWDGALFFASQTKAHGDDAKPEDRCIVTTATKAEYEAARSTTR